MPTLHPPSTQELEHILEQTPFGKLYHFQIVSHGDGECILKVPFAKSIERPGGMVAGPVYFSCVDVAMWLAIMTKLGTEVQTVTTELNSTFLSAAKEQDIVGTATVLKLGRSQIFGKAECRTVDGKLLTYHTISYARIAEKK
jgi:uncharacterized protein (TIGR00369 family)